MAAAKITSRYAKSVRTESEGRNPVSEELFQKGSKFRIDTVYGQITVSEIFDGATSLKTSTATPTILDLKQDELDEIKREAAFFGNTDLRSIFVKFEYMNLDKIDGREVWTVRATNGANQRTTLFFDVETGYLVRRRSAAMTVLGNFLYQVDYSDYKDFGGVKIPTTVRSAVPNIYWTRKITEVKINFPILDSKFEK
jgi:hypothetical protein